MSSNLFGQAAPRGSEGEKDGVTPCPAPVRVRRVEQPVVDDDGVSRADGKRELLCVVAHGRVIRGEARAVGMRLGERRVDGRAPEVRAGKDAQRAVLDAGVGQVAEEATWAAALRKLTG